MLNAKSICWTIRMSEDAAKAELALPSAKARRIARQSRRVKRRITSVAKKGATTRDFDPSSKVEAIVHAAIKAGFMENKEARIGVRVSSLLVEQAKRQTGIVSDTALIEFALANIALVDEFPETMRKLRGSIDPGIPLGY